MPADKGNNPNFTKELLLMGHFIALNFPLITIKAPKLHIGKENKAL